MRRLKVLGVLLTAMLSFGGIVSQASALPLPDIQLLAGESFPITGEGAAVEEKEDLFIEDESKGKFVAQEVKAVLKVTALSALGTLQVTFTGMAVGTLAGTKCNTAGDAAGVVLLNGEFHLVFTAFNANANEEVGLEVGFLILFPETEITCGALKSKVKSPVLGGVNLGKKGEDITTAGSAFHCTGVAGKQELTSYFNDAGVRLEKQLLLENFGTGFQYSCLEVPKELKIKMSKMILVSW